jgi:putative hemolysin
LYRELREKHLAPIEYRVFPHCPLPFEAFSQEVSTNCPPLLKGYLRLGAYICGDPHWDANFNCVDLLMLMPLSRMKQRYANHFMK